MIPQAIRQFAANFKDAARIFLLPCPTCDTDARILKGVKDLAQLRGSTGGLFKRIDENRELLEVLQRDAPEFLASHPWVVGWIQSNDRFFVRLADLIGTAKPAYTGNSYPRPWPGRTFLVEDGQEIRADKET